MPGPLHRPVTALLAALLVAAAATARAQELHGRITLPDGTPAAGAIVEATAGAEPAVRRAVTGAAGDYLLRLAPGAYRIRALRIGFRPTDGGLVTLAAGERRRLDLTLTATPVRLAAVTTRAEARCQVLDRAGGAVATLFDEARKALLASQLAPPEGRPAARVLLETSVVELDGRLRLAPVREVRSGNALRPFRATSPDFLATRGYAVEEPDGTRFFAPDADVLLSERFAAAHCLRLAEARPDRPDLVGVAFEPVGRARGIVRIRGTLWLDRATFALQRLDYLYVGLHPALEDAGLGGSVDFTRLEDGLWFEDRWEIRMPRLTIERQTRIGAIPDSRAAQLVRLDAIQRTGGRVVTIESGGRRLYVAAGLEPLTGETTDAATAEFNALLLRAACAADPGDAREARSTLVGLVRDGTSAGARGIDVAATWQEGHRVTNGNLAWTYRTIRTASQDDGFYALCGIPRERRFTLQAQRAAVKGAAVTVRFEADQPAARVDLTAPR
ncbi:MAG: carboxypeptidase-like regulatory domain-containing protein [Gemmatimonadaceae bacterium]|nr:carboxypeptidase-like regulatory domain-containing protein [Gemmatimonadaceae bacterium]